MGRNKNKNKKKAREVQATKAQGPTKETARTSSDTSKTPQPLSYAEAAAKPHAEEEKTSYTSPTADILTDNAPTISSAVAQDHAKTTARPSNFEDGAINVVSPLTPKTKSGNNLDISHEKLLEDSQESDCSLLKEAEISEPGSPGQLVKEPSEEDVSRLGEDPLTGTHKPKVRYEQSVDPIPGAKTPQAGTGANTEADQESTASTSSELPSQRVKDTLVRSISKAEWHNNFAPESDGQDGAADTAERDAGEDNTGTIDIHPAIAENHRLAQALDENEAALYKDRVLLQDCGDKLEATERAQAKLQEERDRYKNELHEAYETLHSVHIQRQKLQDEKQKHRLREADWEKEKERLEARINQLDKSHDRGVAGGSPANPPNSPLPPGDDHENHTLKDEVQKLHEQLKGLRIDLKEAQNELNAIRSHEKRAEDHEVSRKARIAACETENEKIQEYGGTLDRESSLYQTLKKFADYHDNNGPEPTIGEHAQVRVFKSCIVERRRIMAQAKNHPDPRAFMTPYLDKWDSLALAGGCMFDSHDDLPAPPNVPVEISSTSNSADAQLFRGLHLNGQIDSDKTGLGQLSFVQVMRFLEGCIGDGILFYVLVVKNMNLFRARAPRDSLWTTRSKF